MALSNIQHHAGGRVNHHPTVLADGPPTRLTPPPPSLAPAHPSPLSGPGRLGPARPTAAQLDKNLRPPPFPTTTKS